MTHAKKLCLLLLCCMLISSMQSFAQKKDTSALKNNRRSITKDSALVNSDTVVKLKFRPQVATRRAAILPGWGQATNKEYWKIPIVYGVLAIPGVMYFYNDSWYNKTKYAYEAKFKAQAPTLDSSGIAGIDPQLKNLGLASLQSYRNTFRRDRDYSILYFILAWGLQVADATVFAHLKQFDVSDDLSLQIKPQFNPATKSSGFGLVLNFKEPSKKIFTTK
ncbi:MAG: hypothetical protein RL372_1315 [Bacteroidota bacterium]|jgi:hypothetical protein